jgi:peptide/nickel transport system substrate-binding protein
MKKVLFLSLLLLVVSTLTIMGCATPEPSKPAPATTAAPAPTTKPTVVTPDTGGVIKIISQAVPLVGYPPEFTTGPTSFSAYPCLEPMTNVDAAGKIVLDKLATDYKIAPDGKSITFSLRKGVKFHDGTPWNAEAAKWNLEANMATKVSVAAMWTSVDAVDEYTVRLNLSKYQNNILSNMPLMISSTAATKNGKEWARTNPVGTGPFKFVSFERDVALKYTRNDEYWAGKPYLDGLEFVYIADPMMVSAAMQGKVGNISYETDPKVATELASMGYQVVKSDWMFVSMSPDSKNPSSAFANQKVREALEYAIDKQAITNALGYGFCEPLNQLSPKTYMGYNPDLPGRSFNPTKAKQLLAEAGYASGFKTSILGRQGDNKDIWVAVQRYFKDVGIEADVQMLDNAKWSQLAKEGWQNALLTQRWGLGVSYISTLNTFLGARSSFSASIAKPADFLKMIDDGLTIPEFEATKASAQAIVKYAYDTEMAIPLWTSAKPFVLAPDIRDTGLFSMGGWLPWYPNKAWISKGGAK